MIEKDLPMRPVEQLTKNQKAVMEGELARFRDEYRYRGARGRLKSLPFHKSRTLFGLSEDGRLPCFQFGRQLVHKIVDALLD